VSDEGIGIGPEHQQQIFDVFKRLHTRKEYPGTGIGLSICKRVVERHNGKIWVESELGRGSSFYFTLPKKKSINPNQHLVNPKNQP
jgi:signal transduction histidine kinase